MFWGSYPSQAQPTILNNAPQADTISVKRTAISFLDPISASCNVTPSTTLNFAWALILSRQLESHDITFASTLSGREIFVEGIDCLDGPTLTVIPRRFKFEPTASVQELLSIAHSESSCFSESPKIQSLRSMT
jgi:non-ribosomal peptide synthetase component F